MKSTPRPSAEATRLRNRAEAALRTLGVSEKTRPMIAEVSRRFVTQLSDQKPSPFPTKLVGGVDRTFHELQVHQIELEMQNTELKESRDRMEILVEKYTDLYDFAPVGYFSLDQQGIILEANLMGASLLGLERSHLVKRTLLHFVAPTSRAQFLSFLRNVLTGTGQMDCEVSLLRENATAFWARFRGNGAIDIAGPQKRCRVSVSDITSLKQVDELLHRNDALFKAIIQQAPVGVYVVDDQMRLQQVNAKARPSFKKIHPLTGRDFSEIMGIIWPTKIATEIMERFRHTLKTGQSYVSPAFSQNRLDTGIEESYEWQIQRITLASGHSGVVCFFNNITEKNRVEAAQHRIAMLAASNRKLEKEILRRRASEESLRKSEQHQRLLLDKSRQMQEQLRYLARRVLVVQEEERRNISRELHDVIAQTLTGINIRLAALTVGTLANTKTLQKKITDTQRLVEHSVNIVHRFARELRPAVLDDLGLIPALHSFMKGFAERTGLRVHLKAFAGVEQLDITQRTVLFRIAQEGLTNVARHAHANRAEVSIEKRPDGIRMKISDDGRSFKLDQVLKAKGRKRLGLLGMRERMEMVGGQFNVESASGKGTTLIAQLPLRRHTTRT